MPKITNTSLLNQLKRVCPKLVERGQSFSQEHAATVVVRAILEENGDKELLESSDPVDIEHRRKLIEMVRPFFTASKNVQDSYLNATEVDGKPLMPKTARSEKASEVEFA